MAKINSYKDLIAWQKAMEMVAAVYQVTAKYPADERFGLVSQSCRAAVSVPSNIAEGYGRRTKADYVRFLDVARGSANEIETQLLIAVRLGLVTHLMAAYDQDAMRDAVGAPEGYRIVCVIAVGYPGDPERLPRDVYEHWELRERVRRPVKENFFRARWGSPWE